MKRYITGLLVIYTTLLLSTPLFAFGVGFYGTAGGGADYWSGKSYDVINAGGGFVMDTNLARDHVTNYRLNMGAEYQRNRYKDCRRETTRIGMVHSIGYGLVRDKYIRLWIGPQIIMGYIAGANSTRGFYLGLGGALGVNFNIGKLFTIALTTGIRPVGGYIYYKSADLDYASLYLVLQGNPAFAYKVQRNTPHYEGGIGITGQVNLAFMFRIDDTFGGGQE